VWSSAAVVAAAAVFDEAAAADDIAPITPLAAEGSALSGCGIHACAQNTIEHNIENALKMSL
jgi:hypothetical protein